MISVLGMENPPMRPLNMVRRSRTSRPETLINPV